MTFVKVVGGIEIYNFRIQSFVHYYTNFWSYLISNMGPAKRLGQGATGPRRRALLRAEPTRRPALVSAPRVARGPADRGHRVLRHPRPDVPRI
jgi:hypothetical protein